MQLYTAPSDDADWPSAATAATDRIRSSPDYPCMFAPKARLIMRYVAACSSSGAAAFEPVPAMLRDYIAALETTNSERDRAYLLLAVTFRPEARVRSISKYRSHFWDLMRYLIAADRAPWPDDVPSDPNDPRWSFCFGGVPIFVNANTPAHVGRRSRNLGGSLVVIFQTRAGIDFVAPADATGDRTRRAIRNRLGRYDALPAYPGFTTYGTAANRDWSLYFLPDDNALNFGQCPLVKSAER